MKEMTMKRLPEGIGKLISEAREEKGLSLRDLAERTGLSSSALSRYEDGSRQPTIEALNKILDALDRGIIIEVVR